MGYHLLSTCCDDRSAAVITGNASELTSATVAGVVVEVVNISLVPAPTDWHQCFSFFAYKCLNPCMQRRAQRIGIPIRWNHVGRARTSRSNCPCHTSQGYAPLDAAPTSRIASTNLCLFLHRPSENSSAFQVWQGLRSRCRYRVIGRIGKGLHLGP